MKVLGEGLGEKRKKGSPAKAKHKVNTTRTAAPAIPSLPAAAETLDRTDLGILSAHDHFFQQQQTYVTSQPRSVRSNADAVTSWVAAQVPATLYLPVYSATCSPHGTCTLTDANKITHCALSAFFDVPGQRFRYKTLHRHSRQFYRCGCDFWNAAGWTPRQQFCSKQG